jgi:dTDP-4-dehydrorhamnose 3,5-epimerase
MNITNTAVNGLFVAESTILSDERGFFSRLYCADELRLIIGDKMITQINMSQTTNVGSVRGMHFQLKPNCEMKLIRCLKGKVWDVAIDIRENSPTFLKWYGVELSDDNGKMVIIPEGFAHGFQVIEPDSQLLYLHTAAYVKESESSLNPLDPLIDIKWPLKISQLSAKDSSSQYITKKFKGITT